LTKLSLVNLEKYITSLNSHYSLVGMDKLLSKFSQQSKFFENLNNQYKKSISKFSFKISTSSWHFIKAFITKGGIKTFFHKLIHLHKLELWVLHFHWNTSCDMKVPLKLNRKMYLTVERTNTKIKSKCITDEDVVLDMW
jgi:hypothetical protein